MESNTTCPECGVVWQDGQTCDDALYQMLYWEAEFPEYGVVHHYMVLCFHMQHPSRYSPAMLDVARQMLADFLSGTTPSEMRQRLRVSVASNHRTWKITGTADAHGSYAHPVVWTKTARDVVLAGMERYIESVEAWANALYGDLQASGNL